MLGMQMEQLCELEIVPVETGARLANSTKTLLPFGWHQFCSNAATASNNDMAMLLQSMAAAGQLLPGRSLAFEPRLAFVDLQCLW